MHLCTFYWIIIPKHMNPNQERNYLIRDSIGRSRIVEHIDAAMIDQCDCISFKPHIAGMRNRPGDGPLFTDEEFTITAQDVERLQMEIGQKIVLRRLCRLFPRQHRPPLFPEQSSKPSISRKQSLPPFIYQIIMLGPAVFKGIILNSSFSEKGRYEIIANIDGRYQLEVIDDVIPVYEDSQEPVWSQYFNETWQLLVVKLWAKIKGGYCRLKDTRPFQFIEHFTESNWKYIRLSTEGSSFMALYKGKVGQKCKIFLKSKASPKIEESGLIPDRVAFELVGLEPISKESYVFIIRTVFENAWTGKASIIDKSLKFTGKIKGQYRLNYTLTLSYEDFINLFSIAYITHANLPLPIYHSFHEFSNSQQFSSARYFKINFTKEGFFNFIIQQPQANMIKVTNNKSLKLSQSGRNVEMRYLTLKYMLSRKVHSQSSKLYLSKQGDIGEIGELIRQSTSKFQSKYNDIEFDLYETAHRTGLTKSNAHFMKVIPGSYILRVKAETVQFETNFVIHYSSHQLAEMEEVFMTKQESINFLNDSIISISDQVAQEQKSKPNNEKLTISDLTDTLGYGFAVLKLDKKCPYRAVIQVDPERLSKQGYVLKNLYKKQKQKFKVEVDKGESKAIIFKRIPDRTNYSHPHKAFEVTKIKE